MKYKDYQRDFEEFCSSCKCIFSYNSDDILDLDNVFSIMCTEEEVRARLAELKSFITLLSKNKYIRNQLFADKVIQNDYPAVKTTYHETGTVTEDMLYNAIANSKHIQSITRCNLFMKFIKQLIYYRSNDLSKYVAMNLILGYYMYKHEMLTFPNDDVEVKHIKNTFNNLEALKDNIDNQTVHIKDMNKVLDFLADYIFEQLYDKFKYYSKLVEDRLRSSLKLFYDYKRVDELFNHNDIFNLGPTNEIILYKNEDELIF